MQDLLRMELSGSRFAQNGSRGHGDGKNLLEGVEAFHFNPDGTVRNQIRSRDAEYDRDSKKAFFPGTFGRGSHPVVSSSLIHAHGKNLPLDVLGDNTAFRADA